MSHNSRSTFFPSVDILKIEIIPSQSQVEIDSLVDGKRVSMSFFGVKDLKIDSAFSIRVLLDFEITDVSEYQLEGIRYKVSDASPGCISFYCIDALLAN